ncbi:EpsG family protein [Weissella cibaria]|uniref:EpsG family protein n=1 Tax=Weissella cibaria TaxID=137591 RepID=UPI00189B8441|nr:EpsG family protein [Weissella cibaria]
MSFFLMFYVMGLLSLLVGHSDNLVKQPFFSKVGSLFIGLCFISSVFVVYWNKAGDLNFVYSDLITYYSNFVMSQKWDFNEFQNFHVFEIGYDLLVWIFSKLCMAWGVTITHYEFTLTIFGLSLLIIYFACLQLFTGGLAALITGAYMWYQYFNLFSFNIIRQGMALAICLLATTIYLKNNKPIVSISVMVIACAFHESVTYTGLVPLLLIIIFSNNKLRFEKSLEIVAVIAALLYVTRLNGIVLSKLPMNLVQTYQDQSILLMAQKGGINANDPKLLIMSIVMLVFMRFLANDNIVLKKIYYMMLVISIEFFLMGFVVYSYRIAYSAFFFVPFAVFYYIENKIKTHKSLVLLCFVICIIAFSWEATPFFMFK